MILVLSQPNSNSIATTGIAFGGGAGDGFQAVEVGKFGFHRLDQQFLAVFRRNAGEGDRDEQSRGFRCRVRPLWEGCA